MVEARVEKMVSCEGEIMVGREITWEKGTMEKKVMETHMEEVVVYLEGIKNHKN